MELTYNQEMYVYTCIVEDVGAIDYTILVILN